MALKSKRHVYNVYCDESCHLENDDIPVMVWGAVWCDLTDIARISEQLKSIKKRHNVSSAFEAKWTKISSSKVNLYNDLIEFFLSEPGLKFRGLLVPDKSKIDHKRFGQNHNDWYYKMYFTMLKYILSPSNCYRIYLDVKDTRGGPKTRELHDVLSNNIHDFNKKTVERVEQIRSHESEILQLSDLIIGAIGYANRGLNTSDSKIAIINKLKDRLGSKSLTTTSSFSNTKFNLLAWTAQEALS